MEIHIITQSRRHRNFNFLLVFSSIVHRIDWTNTMEFYNETWKTDSELYLKNKMCAKQLKKLITVLLSNLNSVLGTSVSILYIYIYVLILSI